MINKKTSILKSVLLLGLCLLLIISAFSCREDIIGFQLEEDDPDEDENGSGGNDPDEGSGKIVATKNQTTEISKDHADQVR